MAYDEFLADRIRHKFRELDIPWVDKKMMGGLCFMVDDKMCVGIVKEQMMARIDPDRMAEAFKKTGCREMDFTRRPMKGFIFVEPEGIDRDEDLEYFVKLALEFNPKAKSGKRK
ncbi:MAG: TfoX/Sxy family protein [Bacteroidetes bacterium]|nr:TfoX/Sxy family protein [Bacteroidota bacterium]